MTSLEIAVLPGDGIGAEITKPCVELIQKALARTGETPLTENWLEAGAVTYSKTGNALPDETIAGCKAADAILLRGGASDESPCAEPSTLATDTPQRTSLAK